jgi:hypothetical protein
MRATVVVLIALCLCSPGCRSNDENSGENAGPPDREKRATRKGPPDGPRVTSIQMLSGRVVLVNQTLRYVVVDFGVGQLPAPGQRLEVWREGNKVGEVRISGQARAGNVAADILQGDARQGDEVRTP